MAVATCPRISAPALTASAGDRSMTHSDGHAVVVWIGETSSELPVVDGRANRDHPGPRLTDVISADQTDRYDEPSHSRTQLWKRPPKRLRRERRYTRNHAD
jgi:hypothetical protein